MAIEGARGCGSFSCRTRSWREHDRALARKEAHINPRLDHRKFPQALKALLAIHEYLEHSGLDPVLRELVSYRASLMNGCAYCLDMHSKEMRARGVAEQKIYLIGAWREAPLFSDRERAALAWTEAVTVLEHQEVPDAAFEEVRRHFSEAELVDLTLAVISINGFNRANIAFRSVAGDYKPRMRVAARTPQSA